jgi:hypothetical protein
VFWFSTFASLLHREFADAALLLAWCSAGTACIKLAMWLCSQFLPLRPRMEDFNFR